MVCWVAGEISTHTCLCEVTSDSLNSQLHIKFLLIYCYKPITTQNPCRLLVAIMSSGPVQHSPVSLLTTKKENNSVDPL